MRRTGILTTDADLVIRSWDSVLERMTGIASTKACGQPLALVAPEADRSGVLVLLRDTLASGAVTVLAPAIHHFLIACDPTEASTEFERMQQRVIVTPLSNDVSAVGLAISIEDVTGRLEHERRLGRSLRDPDPLVRMAAVEELSQSGVDDAGTLSTAMGDEDWQVRRAAVVALASRPEPELLHAIVSALREGHHDFSLLSSALRLLSLSGMNVADALIELLQFEKADVRIQAALALGTQSGCAVVSALLSALEDADRNVRFHAIESLGALRARAAVDPLTQLAASSDFFLAFPAIEALVKIGDPSVAERIVPRLVDPVLQDAAADALGALGDEGAVEPLVARLEERGAPVGPIVGALAAIHARYEETAGAGGRIEDLTRRSLTHASAQAILEFIRTGAGAELRSALLVLSWGHLPSVASELTRLLGESAVQHDVIETLVRFGSPILDVLVAQLAHGQADTRRAAAVALGRLGDRHAVPALIEVLEEGDAYLLPPAAGALARLGDRRAFEPLIARLGHPEPSVRQAIIGALNSIGHPEMAGRTATLLHSDDPIVRQSAARIAGYFGYPQCAEALIACGTDPDEQVRSAALEHSAYLDHTGVLPLLMAAVRHDTPRCRAAAAAALGHVAEPGAGEALIDALLDPDAWVRYFAALSLGRRREAGAIDALAALASADTAGQVRIAAAEAVGAIGGARALSALRPLVDAPELDVAAAALRALGDVRLPAVSGILQEGLRSEHPRLREAAAQALATYGGRDAIEALRWTASADQDESVMSAALAGLATLVCGHADTVADAVQALAAVAADPVRRPAVLPVLTKIPAAAVPALGGVLRSADPSTRVAAVEALGRIARPPASSLLMQALDDPEPDVRVRAVEALSLLGARGVVRRIATLASSDDSEDVRRVAELAVARAGGAGAEEEP